MSKLKKITGLFLFMFVASFTTMTAQVAPQPAQEQTQQVDVSDEELSKFADAFQQVQTENQKAQQQMMAVIQEKGMELDRFNEIQEAQMDPNKEVEASNDEMNTHQEVIAEIQKMQPQLQGKMETLIEDNGLTIERYQQVAAALQSDQQLQQKFQKIMMEKQTQG